MLNQRLIVGFIVRITHRPAVGCGRAGDAKKEVKLGGTSVGRRDNCPDSSVPALNECLECNWGRPAVAARNGNIVIANRPAIRPRKARHAFKAIIEADAVVRRTNNSPRSPVPMLDQGLKPALVRNWVAWIEIVADRPAIRRGLAAHPIQTIIYLSAGVG